MQIIQQEQQVLSQAVEDAKLKELYSRATANIAMARERHGRAEADIGLFEERLSEITRNRALATKDRVEALNKLVETIQKFGEVETFLQSNNLDQLNEQQIQEEDREKVDAKLTAESAKFVEEIMKGVHSPQMAQV